MADYAPGNIDIGGPVPRRLVPELIKQIREAGVSLDWGGLAFLPETEQDLVDAADEYRIQLFDENAMFGRFPELEHFLVENGISYDRISDPLPESSGVLVIHRPGATYAMRTDSDGGIVVGADAITGIRKALEAGDTAAALAICKAELPDYPELAPLVFFDEEDGTRDI